MIGALISLAVLWSLTMSVGIRYLIEGGRPPWWALAAIGLGLALDVAVVAANGAMPVRGGGTGFHTTETAATALRMLDDWIRLGSAVVVSPGDLLIVSGFLLALCAPWRPVRVRR